MPVEIKELVIRATLSSPEGNNGETGHQTPQHPESSNPVQIDQDALVAECVKQVLKILKKSRER